MVDKSEKAQPQPRVILNNVVLSGNGMGGMLIHDASANVSDATISNNGGPGISVSGKSDLEINGGTISDNLGGGIVVPLERNSQEKTEDTQKSWSEKTSGKIAIGVAIAVISALVLWLTGKAFGISLK